MKHAKFRNGGTYTESCKSDCTEFLASVTMGETRSITQATIGSIHCPALRYFALFIGRCINGKHDHSHLCVPDLSILKSAVMNDKQFNLGAIIAHRLHNNALDGDFYGGIYATRLADYIGVPIRNDDTQLPPVFLDYTAMECFQFLERGYLPFQYRLTFNKRRIFHITLPAPAFFNFQVKGGISHTYGGGKGV
jgi:hypothetical protein